MNFSIEKSDRGTYHLVSPSGPFSFQSLAKIREAMEQAIANGHRNIVVDLSRVTLLDSGGLGLLVHLNQKLVARGGSLFITGVTETVKPALETSEIWQIIPSLKSVEDADREIT